MFSLKSAFALCVLFLSYIMVCFLSGFPLLRAYSKSSATSVCSLFLFVLNPVNTKNTKNSCFISVTTYLT